MKKFLLTLLFVFLCALSAKSAVEFDGVDDYIQIDNSISTDFNPNGITLSTWVYAHDLDTADAFVTEAYMGDNRVRFVIGPLNAGNNFCAGFFNGTWATACHPGTLNTWKHVVGTYDRTFIRIYVDGVLENSTPSVGIMEGNEEWRIGRRWDLTQYFNGSLSDVRIYNRALADSEVEALYQSRSKRLTGSLANGLIAHYELDDKETTHIAGQVQDDSGNANHGELLSFSNLTKAFKVENTNSFSSSLSFDGIDDHVRVADPGLTFTAASVSLWLKTNSTAGSILFSTAGGVGIEEYFQLYVNPGDQRIRADVDDGLTRLDVFSDNAINDDAWHHLTMAFTHQGNLSLYVDGTVQADVQSLLSQNGTDISPIGDYSIAIDGLFASSFFNGSLANIAVYNKELNPGEISFLYNGSGSNPGTSNLEALWTFEDSAVKDSSNNDNHGRGLGGDSLIYTESPVNRH